jgi:formylglycine-generating enzyme required for sulfatase activity
MGYKMDLVQQALSIIIETQGEGLVNDKRRLEGFLRKYCRIKRQEIRVLLAALEENIARDLTNTSEQVPIQVVIDNLTKRLKENGGFAEDVSQWAVKSWALALGVITDINPTLPMNDQPESHVVPRGRMSIILAKDLPLELECIPAGEFLMGSDNGKDSDAQNNEMPQHTVNLSEYWIGRFPVTVA